jgi:hypothetical protein
MKGTYKNNNSWYRKTLALFPKVKLDEKPNGNVVDWKTLYSILKDAITETDPFLYIADEGDGISADILITAGFDPINTNAYQSKREYPEYGEVIRVLLKDGRADPTKMQSIFGYNTSINIIPDLVGNDINASIIHSKKSIVNDLLKKVILNGDVESVQLLLNYENINPTIRHLRLAAVHGHINILRLLTEGEKIYVYGAKILMAAVKGGHIEILKFLLEFPDVEPYSDELMLLVADSENQNKNKQEEIIKILIQDYRVDIANYSAEVLNNPLINKIFKEYIEDSLSGLIAMHYSYNDNSIDKDIYASKLESGEKESGTIVDLYYQFLRDIVKKRITMGIAVGRLIKYIDYLKLNNEDKSVIHYAVISILSNAVIKNTPNLPLNKLQYFYAFRGFLLLCYRPRYTYKKIIKILSDEGANKTDIWMAAKIIGALIGFKGLIQDGFVVSVSLQSLIKELLSSTDIAFLAP